MLFEPTTLVLKNGESITIRSCEASDAAALMHCVKTYLNDSEYIPKSSEEFNLTIEQEQQWIQSLNESPNSLLLVAVYDGNIIGNIDITGSGRKMMAHTAVIGMGMLQEWRNCGLGSALMEAGITWAKSNAILEILWLQVYLQNQLGLGLYRKMNFIENGIIPNFFKHNGKYYDVLTMSLSVNKNQ